MINYFKSAKSQWFIGILKNDSRLMWFSLLVGIISAILGLSVAVFTQRLIDDIIPSNSHGYLVKALLIVMTLLMLKVVFGFLQGYISLLHAKRFNLNLINAFFKKLLFLPKSFFDDNPTGTLITRLHDSSAIHSMISFVVNSLMLNIINVIVSSAFLFSYSLELGLIALSAFPVFFISATLFKKKVRHRLQEMYVANGESESSYIASIQNSDLIKSHNKQGYFSRQVYNAYGNLQQKTFRSGVTGLKFGVTSEFIGNGFYLIMLSVAAYQTISGALTIGQLAAILGVSAGLLYPIGVLGNAILHMQSARVAFDRMYEVVSKEKEFEETEEREKITLEKITSIELEEVCFRYKPDRALLENVNLKAQSGDMLCVFGKNGSGKSTILNLIMSLHTPQSGSIRFNGSQLKTLSIVGLRNSVAIISQQAHLFDGHLLSNISLSDLNDQQAPVIEFLDLLGFRNYFDTLPDGYDTWVAENGNNLSGGQKQIISLARALYKEPDVLLVDEATAALDNDTERFVIQKLTEFAAAGGIVIMVSHRLRPARASTKIAVLQHRTITTTGSPADLIKTDNLFARYYNEIMN